MAEKMQVTCPTCGKAYRVPVSAAGSKAACKCGHAFVVPAPAASATTAGSGASDKPFDFLADNVQKPAAPARTCPSCGTAVDAGAKLCVHCGTNLVTGRQERTVVRSDADVAKRHKSYDRLVRLTAAAGAGVGLLVGVGILVYALTNREEGQRLRLGKLIGMVPFLGAVGYGVGFSLLLLLAPKDYLESDYGRPWMQKVGVEEPWKMRAIIVALFTVVFGFIGWIAYVTS